eukprot:CAMPEP_0204601908 /NCGR_PEP_ID=MMETSP0661-20131031/56338_1 /ASSEMBLY_ACC=CAM_ASM_000606 /TAXON_ID=109239 /ORGANISM="Alexandrium margalefi, Strain AMGDE01CS-322" /LENGTH=174 /DNA_ID=CAMNT_0051612837 /DNA_START=61 /DNA_END=582 /DNA_ORIENTATION=+
MSTGMARILLGMLLVCGANRPPQPDTGSMLLQGRTRSSKTILMDDVVQKETRTVAPVWSEAKLQSMTVDGDSTRCFMALFEGKKCETMGGVYQISSSWYFTHAGGPVIRTFCGKVSENWVAFGNHAKYMTQLKMQQDFDDRATFVATLDCGSAPTPMMPSPGTMPAPMPEPEPE